VVYILVLDSIEEELVINWNTMRRLIKGLLSGHGAVLKRVSIVVLTSAGAASVIAVTGSRKHFLLASSCDKKMSEENIPGLYSQDRLRSMSINIGGKCKKAE
jgi:hypothetical protein